MAAAREPGDEGAAAASTGIVASPAFFVMAAAVVTLGGVLATHETAPRKLADAAPRQAHAVRPLP